VVVGDDYIQSQPVCPLDLGQGGNPAVNGDNQTDALAVEVLQGGYIEPVAFGEAVGYVGNGFAPQPR
jgi:hypothetical protein